MANTTWRLPIRPPFNFRSAVYSHGWVVLAPTSLNEGDDSLARTERLSSGKVVDLTLRSSGTTVEPAIGIEVHHKGRFGARQRDEINQVVGRMFRVHEDYSEFYALCNEKGEPWNQLIDGSGRLLRSPTLFEDIIKTICTTNIQWSGTKAMVRNLVETLGNEFSFDPTHKGFPTPRAIASASQETLAKARLGYRGPYILELAQQVDSSKLDLNAFEDPNLPTDELRKMLLKIKGVGDYAAATLLMLLGRYEYLGYDTEMRDFVANHYLDGTSPTEQEAFAIYEDWGNWKYLAYWFDNYAED